MLFLFICAVSTWTIAQADGTRDPSKVIEKSTHPWEVDYTAQAQEQVMATLQSIYEPQFEARGLKLEVTNKFLSAEEPSSGTAQCRKFNGKAWIQLGPSPRANVQVTSTFIKSDHCTPPPSLDAFALAACHEIGHVLESPFLVQGKWNVENDPAYYQKYIWLIIGPGISVPLTTIFNVESEADYLGTLKCIRMLWQNDRNEYINIVRYKAKNPYYLESFKTRCQDSFGESHSREICIRTLAAIENLFDTVLRSSGDANAHPPYYNVNFKVSNGTQHKFYSMRSSTTCRKETMVAGALCPITPFQNLSPVDPTIGSCTRTGGFETGLRPSCWQNELSKQVID